MTGEPLGPFDTEAAGSCRRARPSADPGLLPIKAPQNRKLLGRALRGRGRGAGSPTTAGSSTGCRSGNHPPLSWSPGGLPGLMSPAAQPEEAIGRERPERAAATGRRRQGAPVRHEARVRRSCPAAARGVLRGVRVGAVPGAGQLAPGAGLRPGPARPASGAAARRRAGRPAVTAAVPPARVARRSLRPLASHPDLTASELVRVIGAASPISDLLRNMESQGRAGVAVPNAARVRLARCSCGGSRLLGLSRRRGPRCPAEVLSRAAGPGTAAPRPPAGPAGARRFPVPSAPLLPGAACAGRRPGPVLPRSRATPRPRPAAVAICAGVPGPRCLLRAGGAERGGLGDLGRRQLRDQAAASGGHD